MQREDEGEEKGNGRRGREGMGERREGERNKGTERLVLRLSEKDHPKAMLCWL